MYVRLFTPLTDISILVEGVHHLQFPCLKLSRRKTGLMNKGEFNEADRPKTSRTSASNTVFEVVRQTLHITVCEKVCERID